MAFKNWIYLIHLSKNLTDFKGTFKITNLETNQSFEYPFTNEKTFVIPFWVNKNDAKNFRIELSTFNADKEINPVIFVMFL